MTLPARLMTILESLYSCVVGTAAKRVNVVICATQSDGTITPVRCDANGQLLTVAGS